MSWRVDRQGSVRIELPDAAHWTRVKFWGLKSLVGYRYGKDHHAIVAAFVVHVEDEKAPGACSQAFEQWAQPYVESFEVAIEHEPPKAVPWTGKIVDIDALVARTATLGVHDEYAVAYATYPAWKRSCLVMGVAIPARDELERAKAVRDRFATELLPHVRVTASEEPKERYSRVVSGRGKEVALVALAACAFATASPIAKGIAGLSFAGIGAGRCAVAAVGLWAVAPAATWRGVGALEPRRRLALVGAGLLLAAHFALFLAGLQATSLPAAAAMVSLEPIAVVVAAWVAFGVRPNGKEWAGIAIATLGAAAVMAAAGAGEGEVHGNTLAGDLLLLAAVVLFGAYVAFARGMRDAMPTTPYAACVYTVAALALAPLLIALDVGGARPPTAPLSAWLGVAALGLGPTLLGHTLVQRAARHVSPSVVALVSPGETAGAILIGAVTGHVPTPLEWVGAAVIVAGASVTVIQPLRGSS